MPKRVLIVTNVPQDYRIALFNELNRQLGKQHVELKVFFASSGYERRKSKLDFSKMEFSYLFLKSPKFHLGDVERTMFFYTGLMHEYRKFRPDVTIVTGYSIATLKLWFNSFFQKLHYIIWSGSIAAKGRMDSTIRLFLRKLLIRRANGFVAYGSKAKEYLMQLGAAESKISIGINTVDTAFFSAIEPLRHQTLKQPAVHHLTYIGYLTPRKKIEHLLGTIKLLATMRQDFVLDIIGDGSSKQALEKIVEEEKLMTFVKFHGFKQKNELKEYLIQSSCFLFQTGFDIWGLVLNEAMAAGITCMASPNAGAVHDLISNGKNGFITSFENYAETAQLISTFLSDEKMKLVLEKNAAAKIRTEASVAASAGGFINAISKSFT